MNLRMTWALALNETAKNGKRAPWSLCACGRCAPLAAVCSVVWAYLVLSPIPAAADFHVSPTGNDASAGTAAKPFATIGRAQQAARLAKGAVVTLHAGVYYLPETIVFSPADNGCEYRAAPGETVVVSGGSRLNLRWQPRGNGVMKAQTPVGLVFDQLFVDGRQQRMARYPNFDASVRPYGGYSADAFSPQRAARWSDPAGGFIHAMHRAHWGGYHYRITGKNADGTVSYEGGWQNNRQMGMHPQHRYVENILEELDARGEWFHNAQSSELHYMPAAGSELDDAVVEVVRLRHLVEFRGTPQDPVRGITLRGIVFRHAARTFMDVREPLLRSDWTIYRGGAVLFDGAEDCAVVDCDFDQLGGNAVFVNHYNRRITIRGCDIRDTGASAIAFVGDPKAVRSPLFEYGQRQSYHRIDRTSGPQTDNYPADCLVEDCLIRRIGLIEKQAAGIQLSMAMGITIRHCSVYEASRAGINISEGTFGGHLIEFCDVFDTVLETGDHGSFNSWGRDRFWGLADAPAAELPELAKLDMVRPNVIRNSRWRCDHGWDVDLDDGSSNYEIYNNLFLRGGLKLREGFHRKVRNNIAVNNSLHPHVWFDNSGDEVTGNIWMTAYRPAGGMPKGKWGKEIDRNLFTSAEADRTKFAEHGCDHHSLVGDAMFEDAPRGDFRVKKDSPAMAIGFRNFAMDRFGVQSSRLKAIARTPAIPPLRAIVPVAPSQALRLWRGAKVRELQGEEYSAYGVSRESGGVLLVEVPTESAAAKCGFRAGDLIESVNAQPVKSFAELLKHEKKNGEALQVGIVREQKPLVLRIGKR